MAEYLFETPIALIVFNRPDKVERLLNVIRQIKPSKLFIIADGPRPDRPNDIKKCEMTRAVFEKIDWPCEVIKRYADVNLGCGLNPATGITWVFSQVEEAIILEDDCIPELSFFRFCQELLERYRYDQRVMHIAGSNYCTRDKLVASSYSFSRYTLSWGWATWRRAWQHYDFDLKLWEQLRETSFLQDVLNGNKHDMRNWKTIFQTVYESHQDCWDYQWKFACWHQGGMGVLPQVNLISNIGYDAEASHTTLENQPYINLSSEAMVFPLKHPIAITRNLYADCLIQESLFNWHPKLFDRIHRKFRKIFKL
ncbi:MAG: glycosyltransferase family 2 protein [Kovacikia sp.]